MIESTPAVTVGNTSSLDMSWCSKLTKLPDPIGGLRKLKTLNLIASLIESLPKVRWKSELVGKFEYVQVGEFHRCGTVGKLGNLKFCLSGFKSLPEFVEL
ncbi:hypothetical protein KC19_2G181700 [Ceratodon purpureus]|uniref:Uncharacterized protein n=1 Tax=Ceratodon purpureus TaxID=3225 RepID=A0A8T0IY45_CERPU|nr:hypothetical protein KC19_2G181700 [Ceratodon purpureus]